MFKKAALLLFVLCLIANFLIGQELHTCSAYNASLSGQPIDFEYSVTYSPKNGNRYDLRVDYVISKPGSITITQPYDFYIRCGRDGTGSRKIGKGNSSGHISLTNYNQNGGYPSCTVNIGPIQTRNHGNYNASCDFSSSLPIELIEFNGALGKNKTVELTWSTASELNNDKFEIERAVNDYNFKEVGSVAGMGNSQEINDYTYVDRQPERGTNYYRLKQIDFDGQFNYSPVITVEVRETPEIGLDFYPNPVVNEIKINNMDNSVETEVSISSVTGKVIWKGLLENGRVNTEYLQPGTYILTVVSKKLAWSKPFVKG